MPLLATLLAGLLRGLGSLFGVAFAAAAAVRLAAVTALLAFGVTLLAAFNAVIAPLAAAVFSTPYGQLLGLLFPPISGTAMAAIAAVWSACTLYGIQRRALLLLAK